MLEKFITKIKESLPEALQKKLGIQNNQVDEEVDEESDTSTEYRYEGFDEDEIEELEEETPKKGGKSKVALAGKAAADAEDPEAKKKKQMSMLIRVVAIVGLAYFLYDEMIAKKPDGTPVETTTEVVQEQAPLEEQTVDNTATENTEAVVTENTEEVPVEEQAPVDDINISENPTSETPTEIAPVEETPTEAVTQTPDLNEEFSNEISNAVDANTTTSETTETVMVEESIQDSTSTVENTAESTISSPPTDFSPDEQTSGYSDINTDAPSTEYTSDLIESKPTEEIDKKIVSTPVKTPPPTYESFGRGLVYNCNDKHWACVDKPSYIQCNNNFEYNKSVGERPNCFVKAIYTEESDCIKVQGFYVSNSEPTSQCN